MVFDDEIDSLVYKRKISGFIDSYKKNKLNEFLFYAPINYQSNNSIVDAFVFKRLALC